MDRRRAAGLLLALAACFATATAAPTASNHTALDLYDGAPEGCYYNFQHYGEGDRIMTNEPCLNCTCHNRMLMCYLRVCPFTKPIGQDCTIEKRADQCCPIVTCPDVPVDLLTSTTTSPAEYGPTGAGKLDKFGCSINGKYFSEGSKVPPTPNKPCEHCYCIRNMTTCVMQECTLHVDGCTPIYHKDVCCPVRYSCDHPEDEMPLLDDMSTTVRPTPGFLLTTTTISPVTQMSQDCVYDNRIFPDGALIKTEKACDHCYCMKGDIVCVVQECGTPMENEGKNCTALPPREGVCCPDTYICEGDEPTTGTYDLDETTTISTDQEKLTTLTPPRRTSSEGSGYRNEPDDVPYTESPIVEPEMEGSGEETPDKVLTETPKPDVTSDILASTEETHEFIPLTTTKPKEQDETKTEITKEDDDLINIENTEKTTESQQRLPTTSSYYNTNDAAQPTTDKIEDIGSGEQPEDDLRQHEIATMAPVFDDIKENVATTKPYNHEDMPSQGTEKETLEPQEMVTAVTKEDTSHKPSDLDATIEDNRDLTSTDTTGEHEATSPIVSDHEHSTLSLDTIDVTKVPKQTTVKSFEPSDVTTLHTPIIEEDAKVTSKPAEQDVVTGAPDHSIEEVKLQTSTIVPSIEDEFVTTESQPVETDIVKESHHIEPQLVTASTPMLEEIERDTTEYTESGHVIPSGATRDDMFDILSSTATSLLGIEDAKKPEVFQPITTNIPILDQQEEITVGHEKITEAPVDNNIKESSKPEGHPSSTITPDFLDTELKTTVSPAIAESEYEGDKQESDEGTISSVNEIVEATTEPDKGLNTIPSEESPDLQKHTTTEEKITTAADIVDRFSTESEDSVTTTLPLITEDDQSLLTTESAFRKEDYSPTDAEISHKPTTVTADITEEVISTLTHDHTKITESVTDMQLQTSTSSAPKFTQNLDDATLAERISTDSSYDISTSEVSISDITTEKPSSSSVDTETTIANEEDNEIFNEPRIPGEGDCLLNGITYTNESVVPSTNKCQSGCKCVSSIIKCDPIICSPPPEYMNNCETTYDTPDACCPTFICDHKTETMPPQSHSQMSGTETPVISPVQCHDGKCEISKDQKHQTEVSEACKSGNCAGPSEGYDKTTDQSETIPAKPITTQNQECVGEECKQILCSDEHGCQATPVQPCEGEKCETYSEGSTGPETQLCTNSQDCAVPSAPAQECNGNNCNVSDKKPEIHTSGPCAGEEGCLDISGVPEDKCEGSHCRRKDDSSIEQEIITKQPEISQAEHLTTVYETDEDATKSKPEEVTKASSLMDNAEIVTNAFVTDGQSLDVTEPSKTHTPGLQDITESDQKIKPDTEITSSTVTQPSVTIPEEVTGISQEIEPSKPTDGSNADDKLTDNIMIQESTTDDNFSDFVTESSKPFSAEPFITTISSEDDKTSEIFQSTEMPLSYTTKSQDGSKSSEVSRTTTENIGDISSEEHLITLKPDVPFIDPKLPEVITTDQQDVLSESDEMTTQLTEIVSTHDYSFDQEIKTEYPEINYTPQQEQSTIITEKPVISVEGSTNIPTVVKDTMNINEVESGTKPGYDSTKLYDDNTVRPLYQDSKEDEKPVNDLIQSIVTDKYEDETKPSSEDNSPTDLPALITSRPDDEIKQHEHVQDESTTPISIQSETTAKEYDVNDMVSTEYDKPVEKDIITETPADIKETENEIATEKPSAIDIITKPTTQDTLLTEIDSSDKLLDDLNEKSTQSYSTDIPEKQTQYVPVITEVPYIPTRPETLETIAAELPEISSDKPEPTSKPISEDVTQRVSEVFEPGKIQPESTTIEPSSDITLPLELPTVTGRPLEDSEVPTSGESGFTDEMKEEPSGVTTDKQLEPEIYQTTSPNVQMIEMSTRPSASVDESSTTLIHDIIEQKPPTEEQSIPVVIAEKDTTSPPEESIADQTEKIASVSEEPIQDTIAPEEELIIATSQRTTSKDEKETSTFSPTADQSGQPTTPGSYNIDSSEVPAPESPVTTEPEEQTTKISKEPVTSIPDESTSSTPVSPIRITKAPEESIISATATSILDSSEKSTVNESEAPTTDKFEEPITKTPEVPISSETKEPIPSDIEEPITSIPKELFTNAPGELITEDYVTSIPQKLSTSAPEAQTSGIPAKPITRTPEESVTSASEAPITNAPVEVINSTPEEHVSSEPEALATRAPQEIISSEPEVPATKAPVEHISIEPEAPSSKEPEEHISSEPEAPSTKVPEEYVHSEPATPATRAPEEIIPSEPETPATRAPEEPISSEPEISTTKVPEEPISSELDATSTSATKKPIPSELDAPSIRIPEEPISSGTEAPHTKGPEESISSEPETLATKAPEETIDSKSEASTTRAPEESIPIEPQSPATGAPEETNASEPEMPATKAPEQSIINEPEISATRTPEEQTSSEPEAPATKTPEEIISSKPEAPATRAPEEPISSEPEAPATAAPEESISSEPETPATKTPEESISSKPEAPATRAPEEPISSEPEAPATAAPEEPISNEPETPATKTPEESIFRETEAPYTKKPAEPIPSESEAPATRAPEEPIPSEPEAAPTKAPEEHIPSESEVPATRAPEELIPSEPEAPATKSPEEHIPTEPESPATRAPEETIPSEPEVPATSAPEEDIPIEPESPATKAPEDTIASEPETPATKAPEQSIINEPVTSRAPDEQISSEPEAPGTRAPEGLISSETEAPYTREPAESIPSESEAHATKAPEEPISSEPESPATRAPEESISIATELPATRAPEEHIPSEPESPATRAPEEPMPSEPEVPATSAPEEHIPSESEATATKAPENPISSEPEVPATSAPEEPISSATELPATRAPEEHIPSEPESPVTRAPEETIPSEPESLATRAPEELMPSEPEVPATSAPEEHIPSESEAPATRKPEEHISSESEAPATKAPEELISSETEAPYTRKPAEHIPSEPEAPATKAPEEHIPSEPEASTTSAPEKIIPNEPEAPSTRAPEEIISSEPEVPATRAPEETIPSESEASATRGPEEIIPSEPEAPATRAPEEHIASEPESPPTRAPEEITPSEPEVPATRAPEEHIPSEPEAPSTRTPEVHIPSETETPVTRAPEEIIPSEPEAPATRAPEEIIPSEPEAPSTRAPAEVIPSEPEAPATKTPEEIIPSEPEAPVTRAPEEQIPSEPEVPATRAPEEPIHSEPETPTTTAPEAPVTVHEEPINIGPEEGITSAHEASSTTAPEAITKVPKVPISSAPETPVTTAPEIPKPVSTEAQPTDDGLTPDEDGSFPSSGGTSGYGHEPDYMEEDQTFGPGTCRYGGKVYVSAQQIPRDDPCDFCFCFRSDIICLQQSCPPPIHGCHEEPIQGFCCPRYECPVSMATTVNVTTTTTTTTTTLPPHFPTHSYKGSVQKRGCQIKGQTYKVGEVVRASSGPCLHCTCGGDGQMKCDPKVCTPEPMLRQMIAAAVSAKRRR